MAMLSAPLPGALAAPSIPPTMTLRALLDARRLVGRRMSLAEAIAIVVPVCLDLHDRHRDGERLYVHPSAIAPSPDGLARVQSTLSVPPDHSYDRHCLAPELQRAPGPGDACASVYSVGAMLYEMITGLHVGPGMTRPREIDASLPDTVEFVIGKAVVGDRTHRPSDLSALASALYHLAPQRSIHPPEVSEAQLDQSAELEVDIKLSMMPPPAAPRSGPDGSGVNTKLSGVSVVDRPPRRAHDDATTRLAALKAHLESDPRPRYVVIKDKMDHGPFSAVELLQQVASHAFTGKHGLRDEISGQQMPITEWEEFAPFAEQAGLHREKRAEEKAVFRAADADKKRGIAKSIVAVSVVLALGGVLAVWFFTRRGTRSETVVVAKDRTGTVEVHGDIKGRKRAVAVAAAGGGGGGGGAASYSNGQSFESVLNGNNESVNMGQAPGAADLTDAQLSAPLRHASFVSSCGAPDDMKVTVRVAVRMGRAVGVTVGTTPSSPGVAACVDRAVRGLQWAPSVKTDFVTTVY
ncbi:MAG: hypothetical protein M3O36_00535 [Myxococcota bacterium]|nr:hypothetical protein [Myxococcota bacterium]